jgi:N-acetylglucosamine-6-phosphate deacetylase
VIVRAVNGNIVTSLGELSEASIRVEEARIAAITPNGDARADEIIDLAGGWLLPGFIDTQVNGGGGVLFNDQPDVDAIRAISEAHARFGTTSFTPTLISDTAERIEQALEAVDEAILLGVPGVVGIHIEGPFINVEKRGIHDPHRICALGPETVALLTAPRRGKVMVTLAPELCDEGDIQTLVGEGVIVSAGHTNVTYEGARRALAAGLTGFTHVFNAMSPLRQREPGAVGAALDCDAYCGLIVDGAHVHPAVVRIALKAKGPERLMLVTDAMPSVGTDADEFMLQGKRILVRNGVCLFEDNTLAGAHLDMAGALRNCVEMTRLSLPRAAMMASGTPARFLSIEATHGAIDVGKRADWVWLSPELHPRGTWIGGLPAGQSTPMNPVSAQ